jgi:hypothetical protein
MSGEPEFADLFVQPPPPPAVPPAVQPYNTPNVLEHFEAQLMKHFSDPGRFTASFCFSDVSKQPSTVELSTRSTLFSGSKDLAIGFFNHNAYPNANNFDYRQHVQVVTELKGLDKVSASSTYQAFMEAIGFA